MKKEIEISAGEKDQVPILYLDSIYGRESRWYGSARSSTFLSRRYQEAASHDSISDDDGTSPISRSGHQAGSSEGKDVEAGREEKAGWLRHVSRCNGEWDRMVDATVGRVVRV